MISLTEPLYSWKPSFAFTRHSTYENGGHVPVIVRGEGAYIWDDQGRRYLDGLAGLFTVQVGHGRRELADAAAAQARELAFFPLWSYAHPRAIELAIGTPPPVAPLFRAARRG